MVELKAYFALLRSPLGWLWVSRALSDIGDSIHLLAFNWLLVERTGSALAVVTASTLWLGGQVVAGWPGGRLADRFPPVRVLQGTYLLHALVIGVFALGSQQWPVGYFYALAFGLGLLGTPLDPASRGLLVALYPERSQLTVANGLLATGTAVAQTLGPVVGGLVFSLVPLGWAFGVNAVSYLGAGLGLLAVPLVASVPGEKVPPSDWRTQLQLALGLGGVLGPVCLFAWGVAPLLTALLPYYVVSRAGTVL
ncbi:MFS transporter, partial [Candidatus Cyanaurora vandensis]